MTGRPRVILACQLLILSIALGSSPVSAQSLADLATRIDGLQQELEAQRSLIEDQSDRIAEQREEIDRLRQQLVTASGLAEQRAAGLAQYWQGGGGAAGFAPSMPGSAAGTAGLAQSAPAPAGGAAPAAPLPDKPVGEAPQLARVETQVQAVPEGSGVLTPPGRFVFDASLDYTNTSNNRLVFRGIELVPGFQIGVIEASDADRNSVVATGAVRYGLAKNLEIEARVPYLFRSDRIRVAQQRDDQIVRELRFKENNIGDVEFAVRYQLNRPIGQQPIFIGSVRVKTDTGKSPFSIPFDAFSIPTGLATGSGFWAVQPGMNFLLPSDPAVIYGGVSYLWHIPRNINKVIDETLIGRVDPGDAINANLGFGFALNQRFSFSLGYRHSYLFPTKTELGDTIQRSSRLQVGSLSFGMSYRVTERQSLNFGVDVGATEDAPDLSVSLRVPFSP